MTDNKQSMYDLILEDNNPVIILNPQQRIITLNDSSRDLLFPGMSLDGIIGTKFMESSILTNLKHIRKFELGEDDNKTYYDIDIRKIGLGEEKEIMILTFHDVTEYVNENESFKNLAMRDALTGVFNSRYFTVIAEAEFERYKKFGGSTALIMMDIDKFKSINDKYGHDVGDEVLIEFTKACRRALRGSDPLCRYGGDEFIVMLTDITQSQAKKVVKRILTMTSNVMINVDEEYIDVSASIGLTFIREDDFSLKDVFKRADEALYKVKDKGRNNYSYIF